MICIKRSAKFLELIVEQHHLAEQPLQRRR